MLQNTLKTTESVAYHDITGASSYTFCLFGLYPCAVDKAYRSTTQRRTTYDEANISSNLANTLIHPAQIILLYFTVFDQEIIFVVSFIQFDSTSFVLIPIFRFLKRIFVLNYFSSTSK
jgi:hypothetical protein